MYPHTPDVSQMVFSILLKPFVKRTRTDRHARHAHWSFFISKVVTLNVIIFFCTLKSPIKRSQKKKIKRKESRSKRDMSEEPDEQKLW